VKWGIRTQVLAALTLVLGFGLSVSYVVTSRVTEGAVFDARIQQTRQLAQLVAGRLESMLPARGLQAREALASMRGLVAPDQLFVVDAQGHPRFDTPEAARRLQFLVTHTELGRLIANPADVVIARGPAGGAQQLVVVTPLKTTTAATSRARPSALVLISDLTATERRSQVLDNLLLLFTGVILVLALVLGYVALGRLVIRPVQRLLRPVERVREGEFVLADPGSASSAEMVQLYDAFNRMSTQLAADRERIEAQLSELTLKNRELNTAQQQLVSHEKLATVGTLAAGVAHEIGNPIAVLQGYLEILSDGGIAPEQRATYIAAMNDAVRRISTIIRDLLDFARPIDESTQQSDAVTVIRTTAQLLEPQSRFKDVALVLELPQQPVQVAMNAGRLEQVLLNLLLNAADASPSDGTVTIGLQAPEDGKEIQVVVTDQGPGIPSQVLRQMFDPFFTTKDPGEGTGLGLSICHNIVSSYGGRIYAEVPESGGTRFTVVVPRA